MVEKIIINPNKVRGYGNIVSSKGASDFITYAGSITEGTDTVYGATEKVYTVEDTFIFTDGGTSTNYTEWYTPTDNMTVSRSTNETTLTQTNTSAFASRRVSITSGNKTFEFDVCVTGAMDQNFMSIRQNSTSLVAFNGNNVGLSSGVWHHIKLVVEGSTATPYCDGVVKTSKTLSDTSYNRFYMTINANTNITIKYKNFVIYG